MTKTTVPIHIQLQPFFLSRKKYYQLLHLLFLVPFSLQGRNVLYVLIGTLNG
ncbi:hypothetical protein AB7942_19600 [Neobacillus sp. BF23-41]|uniref:hypothetical protein n=1 Tax=Neobacillus sp. BF23-41 TaxID=3240280 RepID=UPI0034E3C68F